VALYRRIRRYGRAAIALHWVVAVGIFVLFVHGATMMLIPEQQRLPALNLHRSIGVVVFALVMVRIWWRVTHPPPPLRLAPELEWVADFVHILIYALLVANGIAGTLGWLASGDPIVFFGGQLRSPRDPQPQLTRVCLVIGFTTARALLVVIALHVLAALKRHVVDRERLLERMWPGRTIMVTLLSALPAIVPKRHARKAVAAKQQHKRRRSRRGRAQRGAAVWTTNAATF
jgi:cytochrome b561